jgi:Domain of unknown function (DUF4174)
MESYGIVSSVSVNMEMLSKHNFFLPLVLVLMFNTSFQAVTPRKLFLFGKGQLEFQTQLRWLEKDSLGVTERDLKIEAVEFNNGLAERYHIKSGQFTLLLIGRDGTEKYRTHAPITTQKLFGIIDEMPMRKSEIQNKNASNR